MFCDMVGFIELSETLGPEEAYSMMDYVYEILIHKVHEFGGRVNEMTGDGLLVLFGPPIVIEEATQPAVRVAMAIHREMVFTAVIGERENIKVIDSSCYFVDPTDNLAEVAYMIRPEC